MFDIITINKPTINIKYKYKNKNKRITHRKLRNYFI
jgi:hypothetical protein